MVYYPYPLHKMKVFGDGMSRIAGSIEFAEKASSSVISLPVEPLQNEKNTDYIIEKIKDFFESK